MRVREDREGAAVRSRAEVGERASLPSGGGAPDTMESWLTLFDGLLHLPAKEKESIRDEIGSHLRERIRDLLLEGYNETNAIHAATRELGDAAELAKKFESVAKGRTRRHIMHAAILGIGLLTTASAGVLVLKPTLIDRNDAAVSFFKEPPQVEESRPPESVTEATITITQDTTLRDIVEAIKAETGVTIIVDWVQMESIGLSAGTDNDQPLGLTVEQAPTLTLLRMLQTHSGDSFDWRFREEETLELGVKEEFDLRERVLASYDIAGIVLRLRDEYQLAYAESTAAITQLITEFVEPELWEDNGGMIAQLEIVGGTLFINAPPRMHERSAWILGELAKQQEMNGVLRMDAVLEGGGDTTEIIVPSAEGSR